MPRAPVDPISLPMLAWGAIPGTFRWLRALPCPGVYPVDCHDLG